MSLPLIVEPQAKAELDLAVEWWSENRSEEQALRWYDGICIAVESLAENPVRCGFARENSRIEGELRELHFGLGSRPTHRILFVIDPEGVRVISVRHAAQGDWDPR